MRHLKRAYMQLLEMVDAGSGSVASIVVQDDNVFNPRHWCDDTQISLDT